LGGRPILLVDTAGLRDSSDEIESIGIARARGMADAADLVLWLGAPEKAPPRALRIHAKSDIAPPRGDTDIAVSVRTGQGMEELIRRVIQHSTDLLPVEGEVAANARQRVELRELDSSLMSARTSSDLLILAEHMRQGLAAIDRITGRAGVEDMLDTLFGRFCIGK
jgi:tRNA modification GTPase